MISKRWKHFFHPRTRKGDRVGRQGSLLITSIRLPAGLQVGGDPWVIDETSCALRNCVFLPSPSSSPSSFHRGLLSTLVGPTDVVEEASLQTALIPAPAPTIRYLILPFFPGPIPLKGLSFSPRDFTLSAPSKPTQVHATKNTQIPQIRPLRIISLSFFPSYRFV